MLCDPYSAFAYRARAADDTYTSPRADSAVNTVPQDLPGLPLPTPVCCVGLKLATLDILAMGAAGRREVKGPGTSL